MLAGQHKILSRSPGTQKAAQDLTRSWASLWVEQLYIIITPYPQDFGFEPPFGHPWLPLCLSLRIWPLGSQGFPQGGSNPESLGLGCNNLPFKSQSAQTTSKRDGPACLLVRGTRRGRRGLKFDLSRVTYISSPPPNGSPKGFMGGPSSLQGPPESKIEMMKFRERNPYSLTLYMYVELFNSLDNIEKWRGQTVDTYRVVRPLVPEVL